MDDPHLNEAVDEYFGDIQDIEELANFLDDANASEAGASKVADADEEKEINSTRRGFVVKYLNSSSDKFGTEIDLRIACSAFNGFINVGGVNKDRNLNIIQAALKSSTIGVKKSRTTFEPTSATSSGTIYPGQWVTVAFMDDKE